MVDGLLDMKLDAGCWMLDAVFFFFFIYSINPAFAATHGRGARRCMLNAGD